MTDDQARSPDPMRRAGFQEVMAVWSDDLGQLRRKSVWILAKDRLRLLALMDHLDQDKAGTDG